MIADDTDGIREALGKLKKQRELADLEYQRKVIEASQPIDLPPPKPLFSDSAPPFRGFCLQVNDAVASHGRYGMIRDDIDTVSLKDMADKLKSLGSVMLESARRTTAPNPDSNFALDDYTTAVDEWDNVTLDSGVTGPEPDQPTLFMWGRLDG